MRRKARLTARSSTKGSQLAGGGVIQINSSYDVRGFCDSKFDVSGGRLGLVNVLGECNNLFQLFSTIFIAYRRLATIALLKLEIFVVVVKEKSKSSLSSFKISCC